MSLPDLRPLSPDLSVAPQLDAAAMAALAAAVFSYGALTAQPAEAGIAGGWERRSQVSDVVTDNGNLILDVHNLVITDPLKLEAELNAITGVIANGLFAKRPADVVIVGGRTR
mgnify:CR=1 FL=1